MAIEPVAVIAPPPHPYSHPLIDWGAAIAGTVIALAIGFTLLLLGVAIGATAMSPWMGASEQAPGWTLAGGLWVIFSNLVALQVGAFVSVRAARWPDHHHGMLQGMVVWALAFVIGAAVLGVGVSGMLHGADGMTASRAIDVAQIATGDQSGARETMTPAQVDAVQDATAMTAWWAVGAMVLGAVGAIAGGRIGSQHPDWHARERVSRPITMADKI